MDNRVKVAKFLEDHQRELPEEYVEFLGGFEKWIRAELESENEMLSRDDWAFAGVDFLTEEVEIQGAEERPWFRVLSSYFEVMKGAGRPMTTSNGAVLEEEEVLNLFAFAEDEGDVLCFDRANNFEIALFLHDEGRVISTDEAFADIADSLTIFYRD